MDEVMDRVQTSDRAVTGFGWARAMALVSLVVVIGSVTAASGGVEVSDFSNSSLVPANDHPGRCQQKPSSRNPCGVCGGLGVHRQVGQDCPDCPFECMPSPKIVPPNSDPTVLDSFEVPEDAMIVHDPDPRSCVDGSPLPGGPFTAAIWNPPEILEQVRPYALEISEDLLSRLVDRDVAAAFVVGLRLPAIGQVVVGPDMHQREFRLRERLSEKSMLEWIASARQSELAFEPLPDDREFWIRYRTEFDDDNDWRLVVESWIADAAQPTPIEFRHTELLIDSVPSTQLPVEASGGYLAPVYRVQGFRSAID